MAEYIYENLSHDIQWKIYCKILNGISDFSRHRRPMVKLMKMIDESTHDTIIESAEDCKSCGCQAENMEYQEFDKIFLCPDCGDDQ